MVSRPKRLSVLVTDGDNRASLAITRSLGRRGHRVIVAERHTPSLAQTSRYCSGGLVYPDPAAKEAAAGDALLRMIREERIDVLLPVSDITSALVSARRDEFERHCRLPLAGAAALARAADKVDTVKLAMELGVPVPRSVFVEDPSSAVACAESLGWPVVVKPRRSRVRTEAGWAFCTVGYARTPEELTRKIGSLPRGAFPVILQERVAGPGAGVFACCNRGRVLTTFSHRRLREKPPSGGVSVLSESVAVPPLAGRYAQALLEALGWHGVAMVEFKVDERDGVPKLMEINGRFWGSLQLAIEAGVDFPALLLDTLEEGAPAPPVTYRVGVKNRWFWGDVDSLLLTLRGGGPMNGSRGARLRAMGAFLKLWEKDLHYENPKLSDLGPWLYETRQWFQQSLFGGRG